MNRMIKSGESLSGRERNCAFVNVGDGRFVTASAVAGFDMPDDSRAIALTDWDGDGRLDVWMSGRTAPHVRFLRNEHEGGGGWVSFRLRGGGPVNRDAIGARVELRNAAPEVLVRTLRAGDSFLSQSDKRLHFGLGEGEGDVEAAVVWPDGKRVELGTVRRNARYAIEYPATLAELVEQRPAIQWESGEALPAEPFSSEGSMRLVYPVPLPPLTLRKSDGSALVLAPPGEGRFRLLNLWNPSCAGCEEELSALTASHESLRAARIEVVAALGPGAGGMEAGAAMLRDTGAPFAFGQLSPQDTELLDAVIDAAFAMSRELVLPTSLLMGGENKVEAVYLGAVPVDELLADVALFRSAMSTPLERAAALFGNPGRWLAVEPRASLMHVPLELMAQGRVAETAAYIRSWADLLSPSKDYGRLLTWVGDEMNKRGETPEALTFYLNALRQGAEDPLVMNNVAWQMATHRDPRVRNGAEAVRWAEKAVSLTDSDNPAYLDTLAAAYAETGDFDRALSTVEQALRLAETQKNGVLRPGLRKAREFYRAGRPFRDGP